MAWMHDWPHSRQSGATLKAKQQLVAFAVENMNKCATLLQICCCRTAWSSHKEDDAKAADRSNLAAKVWQIRAQW